MAVRRVWAFLLLLLVCGCLVACDQGLLPVETEHQHEYHLKDTVFGTCAASGSQSFVCACGDTVQSPVPVPHEYETVVDPSGTYFKEFCKVCGVYTITHKQNYIYNIDFENTTDYKAAAEQEYSSCYRAGGRGKEPVRLELVEDMGDMSLKSTDSNYYILDKSEIVKEGKDFVASMDVRYEGHGRASIFTILCRLEGKGDFSYNGGLVFVEADGKLSTVHAGNPEYYKDVYLFEDDYSNIAVKGSLKTGLYDVYLNEELVRKDVPYVSADEPLSLVCLRYFDVQNAETYTGYIDNLKLYQASIPEFLIDETAFEDDASGGHVHTVVEEIVEPTCAQPGSKREICTTCDEQISVTLIDTVDHVAAESVTCTKDAVCKFCGTVLTRASGHKVTAYTEIKPATDTETGYKKGNCSLCGVEVVEVVSIGTTDDFNHFPIGALTSEVMTENSVFGSDFKYEVKNGAFEIVSEGNNKYIKKSLTDGNIRYMGAMDANRIEISFDLRLDNVAPDVKGLVSLWSNKEMRVISILKEEQLGFGLGENAVPFTSYKVGEWFNVKLVLNTETFDYEIYIDGEKLLATELDPNNEGKHRLYVRENGKMVLKKDGEDYDSAALHDGSARSPFVLHGEALTGFELFHWTAELACSMDDLTVRFVKD